MKRILPLLFILMGLLGGYTLLRADADALAAAKTQTGYTELVPQGSAAEIGFLADTGGAAEANVYLRVEYPFRIEGNAAGRQPVFTELTQEQFALETAAALEKYGAQGEKLGLKRILTGGDAGYLHISLSLKADETDPAMYEISGKYHWAVSPDNRGQDIFCILIDENLALDPDTFRAQAKEDVTHFIYSSDADTGELTFAIDADASDYDKVLKDLRGNGAWEFAGIGALAISYEMEADEVHQRPLLPGETAHQRRRTYHGEMSVNVRMQHPQLATNFRVGLSYARCTQHFGLFVPQINIEGVPLYGIGVIPQTFEREYSYIVYVPVAYIPEES